MLTDIVRCRYLEEHGGTYTPVDGKSQVPSSGCSECDGEADSKKRCAGVPVFVMLPLDTVKVVHHPDGTSESCIQNELSLDIALQTLKSVGVQVRYSKQTGAIFCFDIAAWCVGSTTSQIVYGQPAAVLLQCFSCRSISCA